MCRARRHRLLLFHPRARLLPPLLPPLLLPRHRQASDPWQSLSLNTRSVHTDNTHTHTHTHTHVSHHRSTPAFPSHFLSVYFFFSFSFSLCSPPCSLSLLPPHTLITVSLIFQTHTRTHSLPHTHTYTHTHSLTHSFTLSLSLTRSPPPHQLSLRRRPN